MFVKLYQYAINKKDVHKWKVILNDATKIYRKHGSCKKPLLLLKKEGKFMKIIEINQYRSKTEFKTIKNHVDQDKAVTKIYKEFISIVHGHRVAEEDFETR